ncbi:enoyl-CoA hydratase/isomerase family protein [Patulibacter minatonensis]|uniref:enoyl-CoA hydratase/isomerase family protein n=1 Tax=Patulibacter minatonensis TaxID=298163 RepID=UPI00047BEDEE|nr:enoyl-CoA hydratase/isomerase family protein [Patulibacter minatonensis]
MSTLDYELRGSVGWITMTRPDRMNALHPDLVADLGARIAQVAADPEVRCLVITGTGPVFCAGADLAFVRGLGHDAEAIVTQFLEPLSQVLRDLRALRKPVIAAINGHCVAGGLELALACDLVVAAESARISDGHAKYGLLPAVGGAHHLVRAVGTMKAKEMLFTGERYTASEMQAAGLVNRTVLDEELETATTELADGLAAGSPGGLRRMKQMVHDEADMTWDMAARYELALTEMHLTTPDPHEGVAAFVERRTPQFQADQP